MAKRFNLPGKILYGYVILFTWAFLGMSTAFAQQATIKGQVTARKSGESMPGVNVIIDGTSIGSSTDENGMYSLQVDAGSYKVRASYVGFKTVTKSVTVSAGQTLGLDFSMAQDLIGSDEVVVLGTRRSDRTITDAPVPVDVLTSEEIRETGITETSQILEMLVPSFNFPRPSVTDGTDHVRPATLRGLGPDQVLVLVNGKRRHTTALVHVNGSVGRGSTGVDYNAIPASAIARIEVLRDGAAAQYGSDAIAGVINIILRDDAGVEFTGSTGQTAEGDGGQVKLTGDYGKRLGNKGFLNVSAIYHHREPTNRAGVDPRDYYFGDGANSGIFQYGDNNIWARYQNDERTFRIGDSKSNNMGFMLNSEYDIAPQTTFYAFGGFTYRNGESGGFYRTPNSDRTVRAIYPDGFLPYIAPNIKDASAALGLKGNLSGWDWDLSSVFGRNDFEWHVNHSNNASMGLNSPTDFYAGTLIFQESVTNLDVVRLFESTPIPLSVGFGAEFRLENYKIKPGEEASYIDGGVPVLDGPNQGAVAPAGSQVFPGYRPSDATDESRNNISAYIDLESNVTDAWLISAAGRVEDYSDFGSTVNGKLASRLELVEGFSIRGAISTGFRAPSLQQSYYSTTATVFEDTPNGTEPFEIRTFPVNTAGAKALGAEPLDPEKSLNYSAGIATKPMDNLMLTIDYYHIDIRDRIVFSNNFIGPDVQQLFQDQGLTNVTGGRFFTNAINTATDGVDIIGNYAHDFGSAGVLKFTAGFNYNRSKVTHLKDSPIQLQGYQETLFDRQERGRIEVAQPKTKLNLMATYSLSRFNVMLRSNRFGEFTDIDGSNPDEDQTFSPKWITDAEIQYHFTDNLGVAIGGNNVLNVYPDRIMSVNSFLGIFKYPGSSPYGYNGGYYYARVTLSFK